PNAGASSNGYDQAIVAGNVSLGGATLTATLGNTPAAGAIFTIIDNTSANPTVGAFAGLGNGSAITIGNTTFHIYYNNGNNDVTLAAPAAPVLSNIETGNLTFTENQAATPITGNLTITDADSANLTGATVTIVGGNATVETLLFGNQSGITGNYTAGVLTLT